MPWCNPQDVPSGRSAINAAFAAKRLQPNVVLTALDSDVIKTYVELGMGAGIVRLNPDRCTNALNGDVVLSVLVGDDPKVIQRFGARILWLLCLAVAVAVSVGHVLTAEPRRRRLAEMGRAEAVASSIPGPSA